ncbi:MAG: hypothetical protein DMG30_28115 [Acidobacteria bacterium]|nr:MAG: hypothetical protein DMG30_28115 [Acidobacteriota bacterium]
MVFKQAWVAKPDRSSASSPSIRETGSSSWYLPTQCAFATGVFALTELFVGNLKRQKSRVIIFYWSGSAGS